MMGETHTVRIPFRSTSVAPQEFELAQAARDDGARIRGKGFDRDVQPSLSADYSIVSMTFPVYGMADEPTKRWIVEVSLRGHMTIEVDAVSEEEAGDIAYDMAQDDAYEADLDVDVERVRVAPQQHEAAGAA